MSFAFNCADDLAFSSLDVAKENLKPTPYPQLAAFPMAFNEQVLLGCLPYPTTLDRSVIDPVVSDIPSLLFLGRLDKETPSRLGPWRWPRGSATRPSWSGRTRATSRPPSIRSSARQTSPPRSSTIRRRSRTWPAPRRRYKNTFVLK